MPSCIVYLRTSTLSQKESETIGAQVERCKRLIERHNLTPIPYGVEGWITDDGVSGSLLQGRKFGKLISDLEAGTIRPDYLVVYSLSRISRVDRSSASMAKLVSSGEDDGRIRAVLIGARVSVIDEEGINDPTSLIFSLKQALSAGEYSLIRSRTIAGKKRLLGDGKFARGGAPPYGYRQVPCNGKDRKQGFTLAKDETTGPRLIQILEWYCNGGLHFAARECNLVGWPSPYGKATWSEVTIQHIVRNVGAYMGSSTVVLDGEAFEYSYPALIDLALFNSVTIRAKEKALKRRAVFLSTGMVDCACGKHLHQRSSNGSNFARCTSGCGTFREADFSAYLERAILIRILQTQEAKVSTEAEPENNRDALVKELAAVQDRIARLLDLYVSGEIEKGDWKSRNAVLAQRKLLLMGELQLIDSGKVEKKSREEELQAMASLMEETFKRLMGMVQPLEVWRKALADLTLQGPVIVSWGPRVDAKRKDGVVNGRAQLSSYIHLEFPKLGPLEPWTFEAEAGLKGSVSETVFQRIKEGLGALARSPDGLSSLQVLGGDVRDPGDLVGG